ncbi:uncharacterized protein LOC126830100 isoform X3 [Patella vulgata]|uniref:uncharacterized protein LOC126830100 isoform X3 n=1 Tax=Patella vulgata TaxID=6465 RepID=UPI0024A7C2F2|nr:uncharacterized protein LOC126830100 isoform X3 [Patella vulgata]XP_055958527.1 uncharacterized protein LOC126830100 isoform X3 [Patella vulgata]
MVEMHPDVSYRGSDLKDAFYIKTYYQPAGIIQELEPFIQHNTTLTSQNISTDCINNGHSDQQNGHSGTKIVTMDLPVLNKEGKQKDKVFKKTSEKDLILESDHDISTERSSKLLEQENADIVNSELRNNDKDEIRIPSSSHDKDKRQFCLDDIYNSDVVRLIYEKTCQDSIDHQRQLLSDILDMLPNEQFECPSPDESWSSSTGPNVTNNDNTKFDRLCTVLINQTDNKHIYSAKNSNSSFDNYQDRLSVDLSIQSLVEHEVDVLKSETDVKLDCSREDKMTSDSKNNFDKTDSDLINKLIHTPKTLRDDFLMCDVPNLPTETNSQQISCILSYVDFREENGGEAFITSGNFKEKDFISQQEFYDSDEENLQETLSREGEIKTSTPRGEGRTGCSVFDGSDEGISSVTTFPQDINITNEISGAKIDVKSRELMDVDYNSVKFDTSTAVSNKLEHVNGKTQTEREQEYFVCSHDYNKTNADFTEVRNDKTIFSHDSQELFEKNSNEIQDFITYEQISFLNSQTVEPLDISRKQLCLNNQNKTFGENVSFLQQCDNQDGSITSVKTDFGYFCDLDKSFSLQSRHGASDNSLDKSIEESSEMSTSSEIDHFSKVCVSFCPTMTSSADDLEAQTREAACSLMGVYQGNTNVNMADNMSGVIRAYGNSCDPVNGARIPLSATVISDNMEKKLNTPLSCQNSDTINITENNIGSLSEIGTTNQMEQYQNNKVVEEFNNRITSKHITTPTTRVSGKFSRTNISKNSVNFDKSMPKKQPEKISKLVLRDSKSSVLTVSYNGSHISSHIQDGKCFDNAKNTNLNGGKNLDNLNSTMNEDTDLSAQNRDCKFYINEGFTLSSATVNKIFSDKMLVQEQNKMEEKDKTPRNDHTTAAFSVANSDRLQDSAVFICNTQSHSILSESMMKKNEIPNLQNNLMSEFSNLKVQTTNMQANSLSNHSQMKITAGYSTQRAASNWGRLRAQLPQIESTKMTNNSKVKGQPTISCNSPEFNERIVQLRQSAEKFDQARNKQIKGCNSPQLESRFCRVAKAVIVKSKANVMSEIELAEMKINQHKECLPVLSVDLPENLDLNIPKDQNMISENPPLEKPVVNQDKKSKTINKTERRESTKTRSSSFKQKSTKIQSEEEVVSTKHATLTKPKNDERLMENRDSTMTQQKINNPYKSNTSTRITPSTKKSCKPSSTFSRKIPSANKGSNKSTISVIDQLNKPEVTSDHNGQTTEINIVAINDDQVAEMNKIILAIKEGGGKDISEIPEAGKTDDESNQAETCLEVTSLRSQNEEVTSQETEFNLERIFQTNHQDHIIPQSLEEDGKLNRSEDQIVDLLIDENKMHQETESENIMNKNNQVDRETDHNQSVNDEQSSSQTIVNDQPISQKVSMITLIKAPVKAFPQQQPKPTSPQPQIAEIPDVTLQNQDDSSELSEDDPEIKMARLNRFKATKALWKKTIGQLINNAKTPESPEKDQGETDTSRNKLSPGRDKILTIRRSLNERLTTPIMSPIPTRKYLWVKGEGGIWKKEYCDSPQDGSLSPCPGYSHPQSVSPCPFRSPSPSSFLKDVRPDFSSDKISDVKNVRKTLKSPSNISNATDHAQTECSLLVAPEIILNGEDSTLTASKPDMIHGLGIITDEEEITTEEKKLSQVKEMTSENEEGRTLELGGKPSEITKLNLKITERNLEFEEKLIEITEKNAQDDLDVETSDEFEIEPVYENIGASMKMVIKNKNMELAIGEIPENHKTKNDPKNLTERSNNRTSGMLISDVISNTNISLNENMNINTCCDPHLCHDVVSTHVVFHGSKTSNINHTEIQHVSNTELQNKNIMQKVMKDEYSSSDEVCCKDKILDPNNQKQDLAKIPDFQNNIVHRPNILQMQKLNSNFETGSVEIKGREKTHDKGFQSNDVWQGSVEYILESPVVCKLPETKETRISETSIDHHFTELKVVSPDQENVTQQNGTCMSNSSTYRETIAAQNVVVPRRMKKQVKSKNLKLLTEGAVRCPSLVLEESYSDEELLDHEDSKLRKCVVKFDSCKSVYLDNSSSFRQEESSEKGQQCHSVPETENGKFLSEISEADQENQNICPDTNKKGDNSDKSSSRRQKTRKLARRSLSLPSGHLSYSDNVKISYVNGHFAAKNQTQETSPDNVSAQDLNKNENCKDNTSPCDFVEINSMREEILSLLNKRLSTTDNAFCDLAYDWNFNHVEEVDNDKNFSSVSSTLPRRRKKDGPPGQRPLSVDESQLWRNSCHSESSLCSNEDDLSRERNQDDNISIASSRYDSRYSSQLSMDEDTKRSKSPNFFKRMLSKRKSFSEKFKPTKDEVLTNSSGKDGSVVRRMSFRSFFKRKGFTSSRKESDLDEPNSPPIVAFLTTEDIGAISLQDSPYIFKCPTDNNINISQLNSYGINNMDKLQTNTHQSSSNYQSNSRDMNQSSNQPPPRPSTAKPEISPRRKNSVCSLRQAMGGLQDRNSGDFYSSDMVNLDGTLSLHSSCSPNSSVMTLEGDVTLTDCDTTLTYQHRETLSPHELERHVQRELTGSNSNDSGIQHDLNFQSSADSLQRVLNEANSHIETTVRLRKSPSPHRERPKSDTTYSVRWADLLEQVREKEETFYTKDGQQIRRKPRPKSDIEDLQQPSNSLNDDDDDDVFCEGGSSLYMSHMRAFLGSIGNLRPCDSLRSLVELRRQHQEYGNKAHKVVKNRRMSTPHPIKSRTDKKQAKGNTNHELVRSHSMPESLDKLHRRKNFLSLIGCDTNSIYSQSGGCDDSSDESEISVDFNHQEKSRNIRGSLLTLQTLDELIKEENMIYAEALWDHVTMDTDEMGFRAGDLVRVTDLVDKDWWFGVIDDRQGWFPATFVRLRVNQAAVEEEMTMTIHEESENVPKLRHHGVSYIDKNQARANVVNEIINAEREYSKHLKDVVEGYVKQARKRPEMFSEEKITTMFGNIEEIYTFASKFHTELEKHINPTFLHLSEIGGTFLDNSKHFEIYSDYCNNHPSACDELKESYRNKRYRHFFEACRLLQDMIEIPLEGFLLTPVQKICKYHLQLAELLKYTPLDHPDHTNVKGALEAMKKIATLINERKRKMESIEKIATWQMSVDTWEGPDLLDISSELIYSGELHKINSSGWSQERYFFLFDHQVVYCKKDILKKNSFCYKGRINLDQCEVIPQEDGKDTQYNVTVRHAWKLHDTGRDKWYLLVAKSDHVKQRWLKAFEDERQRVKDDQENNFNIPAHIREKAIHNVKQKTNLQGSKGFLLWLSRR